MSRVLLVLALGAAPSVVAAGAAAPPASGSALPNWIISAAAIGLVDGYTGSTTLTTNAFDVPSTAEIGAPAAGWVSQRTATFTFYGPVSKSSSFLYALKHGTIPRGTVYVMLDQESWSLTPHAEQVTPQLYMKDFVAAAVQHGYEPVLAPAMDLTSGMSCAKSGLPAWENYLVSCSVPTMVASAGPAVYEVQSQSLEADTSAGTDCGCFAWFVTQAVAQARAVVSGLDVRAGLSTNPGGHVSSGQTLYTDTMNTDGAADGYWLNVPVKSTACPSCVAGGAPQVAVSYLQLLGYQG
jgi:hypothetical protein